MVDDEASMRDTLRDCLEPEGYRISEAERGKSVHEIRSREAVDLILLDLRLRDEDGLAIARDIRSGSDVPIIMITAKGDPLDRIVGLEIGADDYIVKPFHVREVLARVRSVLRRHQTSAAAGSEGAEAEAWAFDGWQLDATRRQIVSPEGNSSALTTSEFDLLVALLKNANRPLTRDQIIDLVKGQDWFANDRVIDNQILRLRRKMAYIDGGEGLIQSVRGVGYVLAASVVRR